MKQTLRKWRSPKHADIVGAKGSSVMCLSARRSRPNQTGFRRAANGSWRSLPGRLSRLLVLSALACSDASAFFCQPKTTYLYVGNRAADAKCDFNTIQDAIAGLTCPYTTIVVSNHFQTYPTTQAITIQNKQNLSIVGTTDVCGNGGPVLCDPSIGCGGPPPAQVMLSGQTNGGKSVIAISGDSTVTLANLEILGGSIPAGSGGGIDFEGSGLLTLDNLSIHDNLSKFGGAVAYIGSGALTIGTTTIYGNTAAGPGGFSGADGIGGGVYVKANGGHIEVMLENSVTVSANGANSGAGIDVEGDAHLLMVADNIEIKDNSASYYGGGLRLGNASADIGSPGNAGNAVIHSNHATYEGAGILVAYSVVGSSTTLLRLFTTDSGSPVSIDANIAHESGYQGRGGGLYVDSSSNNPVVCLFDFRMRQNQADDNGSAIYAGNGKLYINTDPDSICDVAGMSARGATPCAAGTGCNELSANVITGSGALGDQINGGTLFAEPQVLHANRLSLLNNVGGHALYLYGGTDTVFSNCLIATNGAQHELIHLEQAQATFDGCTIAGNTILADGVFATLAGSPASDLTLTNSIVYQPTHHTWLDYSSVSAVHPSYLIANDLVTLPANATSSNADPLFVDPASGNFRLQSNSPAIDYAPPSPPGATDIDRQPRCADLGNANTFGPRDLGPYELQIGGVMDRIYLVGFE